MTTESAILSWRYYDAQYAVSYFPYKDVCDETAVLIGGPFHNTDMNYARTHRLPRL